MTRLTWNTATAANRQTKPFPGAIGLAGWLLARWRNRVQPRPVLALVEKINLAPRQTLCLIEAEGRRFLIACSPEGGSAFYPLDERQASSATRVLRRVSW